MDLRQPLSSDRRLTLPSRFFTTIYNQWVAWTYGEPITPSEECTVRRYPIDKEQFIINLTGFESVTEPIDLLIDEAMSLGYNVAYRDITTEDGKIFECVSHDSTEVVIEIVIISHPDLTCVPACVTGDETSQYLKTLAERYARAESAALS